MSETPPPFTAQILVVDDEEDHAEVLAESLRRMGHVCTLVHSYPEAHEELMHGRFDLVVTDLVMDTDDAGMKVLADARMHQPESETVMVTAHGDLPSQKAALRGGAFDFIEKPLDLELLRNVCGNAIASVAKDSQIDTLEEQLGTSQGTAGIIGNSPAMRKVIATIKQLAPSPISVLITGESGTGKELIARAIHSLSDRVNKRFVPVNCAGLNESLLEDELFGHVKGAYTGADKDREGRFEYADKGTLFLDEVGDMPQAMQAKLLRVLESGEVVRVGANEPRTVNVRLVSATNRDLKAMSDDGEFRNDLYYRIVGHHIHIPPLRERREDVPLLVNHYVKRHAEQLGKPALQVAEDVHAVLRDYDWPGNVRQLANTLQSMVVQCDGDRIEMRHVPENIRAEVGETSASNISFSGAMSLKQLEKQALQNALGVTEGNREEAAKILGIGERTLYRKLKEYGLK